MKNYETKRESNYEKWIDDEDEELDDEPYNKEEVWV